MAGSGGLGLKEHLSPQPKSDGVGLWGQGRCWTQGGEGGSRREENKALTRRGSQRRTEAGEEPQGFRDLLTSQFENQKEAQTPKSQLLELKYLMTL